MRNAVFAGTFDPVTIGHEAVIEKSSKLFDNVTVAICVNPDKKATFSVEARLKMLNAVCKKYKNVNVVYHEGWLVDLMKKVNAIYNVRGVRNATDYEYENYMHYHNEKMYPEIVTIYLPCSENLKEISSSNVKKELLSGELNSQNLSSDVIEIIKEESK